MKIIFFAAMLLIAIAPGALALSKADKCQEITSLVQAQAKAANATSNLHDNRKYSQLSASEIKEAYNASNSNCMAMNDAQVDMAYQYRGQMKLQK